MQVSMPRKCNYRRPQNNPRQHEERHSTITATRQVKQPALSLPQRNTLILFFVAVFLGYNQYWPDWFMVWWFLCPGTPKAQPNTL